MKKIMKLKAIRKVAALALVALLVSCTPSKVEYKTKKVEDLFQFDMPTYMTKLNLDNPDAILEYGHLFKEHYVMVITESVEELAEYDLSFDLESYSELMIENIKTSLDGAKVQKLERTAINDIAAKSFKVWGVFPDNEAGIFYYITILKSSDRFFSFYTWTLKEREDRHINAMEHMTESFKVL